MRPQVCPDPLPHYAEEEVENVRAAAFLAPDVKGATRASILRPFIASCCKVHITVHGLKFSAFLHSTSSLSFLFFHL